MATYDFSTLIANSNKSQAFLTNDFLTFNDTIRASETTLSVLLI